MRAHPPFLNAGNAGPFTLEGTRTYKIGDREVVLLDPGPDVDHHVRALVSWVEDAESVRVVVTHGHADHAGSARRVAEALGAPVLGPASVASIDSPLTDGDEIQTDHGALRAVHTPGHTEEHLCFHWPERDALFAGDLLLGRGDTTWVAEYPGCVEDYLASLERIRMLAPSVIYPAHGPPLEDVPDALARYERHRRERIRQVADALDQRPDATVDELLRIVYGPVLPSAMERAARRSLNALLEYARAHRDG